MGDYSLAHKCGMGLQMDFTPFFNIKGPSAQFFHEGIRITSIEFTQKAGKNRINLYCAKCKEDVEVEDTKNIMVRCLVCRKDKSIAEVNYCDDIPAICQECTEYVLGTRKNPPPTVRESLPYVRISKGARFTLYSQILLAQKLMY